MIHPLISAGVGDTESRPSAASPAEHCGRKTGGHCNTDHRRAKMDGCRTMRWDRSQLRTGLGISVCGSPIRSEREPAEVKGGRSWCQRARGRELSSMGEHSCANSRGGVGVGRFLPAG